MRKKIYCNALDLCRKGAMVIIVTAAFAMWALPGEVAIADGFAPGSRNSRESPSIPVVTLNPDNLDFGDHVVKRTSKPKRITVKNTGDSPLNIDNVEVRGDNPNAFSVVKDTCTGATVEPDRACIVDVTFTPSGTGGRIAHLRFDNNAPDDPQRLSLKGNGINAIDEQPFRERRYCSFVSA